MNMQLGPTPIVDNLFGADNDQRVVGNQQSPQYLERLQNMSGLGQVFSILGGANDQLIDSTELTTVAGGNSAASGKLMQTFNTDGQQGLTFTEFALGLQQADRSAGNGDGILTRTEWTGFLAQQQIAVESQVPGALPPETGSVDGLTQPSATSSVTSTPAVTAPPSALEQQANQTFDAVNGYIDRTQGYQPVQVGNYSVTPVRYRGGTGIEVSQNGQEVGSLNLYTHPRELVNSGSFQFTPEFLQQVQQAFTDAP
ncbi:MAG: hypothetical protein SFZ03_03110 [Candidatus Melainabacteria bacterium]|nr:hypothetical protein [Candidatus Melainabacteria bacterium]